MSSLQLLSTEAQPIRLAQAHSQDRELLIASKQFAVENRWTSWWHLVTTLLVLFGFLCVAGSSYPVWVRALSSGLVGLTLVRMFIIYHDYQHGSIFGNSQFAGIILFIYGHLMLTPPSVWRHSHNHHHQHNSKIEAYSVGSFPVMTTDAFKTATTSQRIEYQISRSSAVIILGYFAVFLWGMCLVPLFRDRQHHYDAIFALAGHFGLIAACIFFTGTLNTVLVFVLPTWIAMAVGSYLFYVQHNFPGAKIRICPDWTYTAAALQSSSYLETGRLLRWFTGNIGYHHVHHLNARIPFYRLPEAMAKLESLQSPGRTSFKIREIVNCLSLKLWDIEQDRFVTFAATSGPNFEREGA